MKPKPTPPTAATPLRRRAETRLRESSENNLAGARVSRSAADTQRLLHELQVHQIELQMQNEELRQARDEMEAGMEKYSELYDFAPVGYLTLNREGAILEANLAAAALLGIARGSLMKQRFGFFVSPGERGGGFHDFLQQIFTSESQQECDVQLRVEGKPPIDVRIRANRFESGAACRLAVTDITAHKLAEAAVHESEERFRVMANAMSQLAWIARPDGHIFWYNQRWHDYTGTTLEQMQGWGWQSVHDATELPKVLERWKASLASGHTFEMTFPLRGADGTFRLFLTRVVPLKNAANQVVQWFGTNTDVHKIKQAEDRVRVSEIRFRRLFETAHDGVLLLDPRTRKITDANPLMTKLLGYSRAQLVGKELFEIGLLKDETASQVMFRKLTKQREVRYEDLPLESRDGRHQEVEVVANLYEENGHRVIQCNIRDITARKEAEAALRASEERYRALFNSMDEGYCIVEVIFDKKQKAVDWRYLEVNPAFEKLTGMRGALGKRIREFAPDLEEYWFKLYGQVALTGKPARFLDEAKPLHSWFDIYAFRIGGKTSRKIAVLFTNVTERKRGEAALLAAQADLVRHAGELEVVVATRTAQLTATNRRLETAIRFAQKSKDEFRSLFLESQEMQKKIRLVTHQVLTAQEEERKKISRELHDVVVQTLVGINVELSALSHGNSPEARRLKDRISHTKRLVESSVDAVHSFARELRPAVLDDLGLIPALHSFCVSLAARKKIKIKLTAFGGVEAMQGDHRTVLFRVAQEALGNVARHARASHARLTITKIAGAIRMEIGDNGQSFPVAKILGAKNPRRLGLVGMKERVEMIGGRFTIVSIAGTGTTVCAEIPFNSPPLKK